MSFVRRQIEATITLGQGDFGDGQGNTVKLAGLRMSALKQTHGQEAMGSMQMRIFGLPLTMINKLTTIGPINSSFKKNTLLVAAGDEGSALSTIFQGNIISAWGDFQGAPDVVFVVMGLAGFVDNLKPIPVSTFKGSADAANIMQGLAATMGLAFENNNVSVILSNPYFPGTALEQVRSCARAAGINYLVENGTLAIWPRRGVRKGEIPIVSPATGMVGYPSYTGSGLTVRTIFTPSAVQGGQVRIESILTPANGVWPITSVSHEIECLTPGGAWFTSMELARVAVAAQ